MRRSGNKKFGALILALLFLSACGGIGKKADEPAQQETLSFPVVETPGSSGAETDTEEDAPLYGNAYAAYYAKCLELIEEYGQGRLVENTTSRDPKWGGCYTSGLCFADLIDLNGGDVKELLVVYLHEEHMDANIYGMELPHAENYRVEVWTYEEEQLELLLSEDRASCYLQWDSSQNEENCFLTVYEENGKAMFQICEDSREGTVFTNYSCSTYTDDGKPERRVYTSADGKFYEDGEEVTESFWYTKACGYDTILASVQLSSSQYGREGLAQFGMDMSYGLDRSSQNIQSLSDATAPVVTKVSGAYLPAYMEILWKIRQDIPIVPFGLFREPEFALYDLDGNGVPELIVNIAPNEAAARCQIYTFTSGQAVLCGEGDSGHCTFYTGDGDGLVRTEGHMDIYHYEKWELQGTELVITEFASGTADPTKGYPPLEDYGYRDYDHDIWFWRGDLATLLYMSSGVGAMP